jgi:hypothetical protein
MAWYVVVRHDRHHISSLDEACGGDKSKVAFGIWVGERSVLKETSKTVTDKRGTVLGGRFGYDKEKDNVIRGRKKRTRPGSEGRTNKATELARVCDGTPMNIKHVGT